MRKSIMATLVLAFFATPALAQQPAFTPIQLDIAKINELLNDVPMTVATRQSITNLVTRWELEAQKASAAPVAPIPEAAKPDEKK